MTLLVVELAVPEVTESELTTRLADLWPRILIYAISFVVLGVYWSKHHLLFRIVFVAIGSPSSVPWRAS